MRLTVYKSTFSSANSRGASSNSHACFIVLTRLSQVRRGLQACWRAEGRRRAEGLPHVFAACRTISRFLSPYGRQPFIWAGHCSPALATYPRVHRSGPLLLSYLVLLRVGFALPAGLLRPRCALTAPFHPYPKAARLRTRLGRYIFCCTFRKGSVARTLPGR